MSKGGKEGGRKGVSSSVVRISVCVLKHTLSPVVRSLCIKGDYLLFTCTSVDAVCTVY